MFPSFYNQLIFLIKKICGTKTGSQSASLFVTFSSAQTSPTVSNCTFTGNSAGKGGGVYAMVGTEFPTQTPNNAPTFTDCVFSNNSATNRGGGVANDVATHPTFIR